MTDQAAGPCAHSNGEPEPPWCAQTNSQICAGLSVLGWLISPTRKIIDCWKEKNTDAKSECEEQLLKAQKLKCWNLVWFIADCVVVLALSILPAHKVVLPVHTPENYSLGYLVVAVLAVVVAFSRINELTYAFYQDAMEELGLRKKPTRLKPVDRVRMAMRSYFGLAVSFALFYFFLPWANFFDHDKHNLMLHFGDALYFSLTTITTLGYGDIAPSTGAARFLAMWEALLGIFLVVVAVGAYVGAAADRNPK